MKPLFPASEVETATRRLGAVLYGLGQGGLTDYGYYWKVVGELGERVAGAHRARGFHVAPMQWVALLRRLAPGTMKDAEGQYDLVRALMVDLTPVLVAHLEYRFKYRGNVAIEFAGPTGMAKSSSAVALADHIKRIQPEELLARLAFDFPDGIGKLAKLGPRDTLIFDEQLMMTGEGSVTNRATLQNMEDTIRASMINLFWVAPEIRGHAVGQMVLELVLWDPEAKRSLFLVHVGGELQGHVVLPWMRPELYEVYAEWKEGNVERSKRGAFGTRFRAAQIAIEFLNRADVLAQLEGQVKPNKTVFENIWYDQDGLLSFSTEQERRILDRIHRFAKSYHTYPPGRIKELFGIEPNENFAKVAALCYEEGK